MLNMLKVKQQNGNVAPFKDMVDLNNFPPEVTPVQKLIALTEQYLFAYYLKLITNDPMLDNLFMQIRLVGKSLPSFSNKNVDEVTYSRYKKTFDNMLNLSHNQWGDVSSILNNYNLLSVKHRVLSKSFYEPLLYTLTGKLPTNMTFKDSYKNPSLYIPKLYKENNSLYLTYRQIDFNNFTFDRIDSKHIDNNNPFYNHLVKLSWNGKSFGTLVDTIASFNFNKFSKHSVSNNIPAALYFSMLKEKPKHIDCKKARTTLMSLTNILYSHYRIDISDTGLIGDYLTELGGYTNLNFITSKRPTVKDRTDFERHPELQFMKSELNKYRIGLEAAEPGTEDPTDESEDEKSNPESDNAIDNKENTDNIDTSDDITDEGSDDISMDDDMGMDDSLSDPGTGTSTTGGSTDTQVKADTTPQVVDPMSVLFKVATSETLDEYLFRLEAISAIRATIKNPPIGMSADEILFLTNWLTRWINVASVETTKSVLSKLSSKIVTTTGK